MNILKKIIIVLKEFFHKKNETKMIVAPKNKVRSERKDFTNLLEVNIINIKKNKVETQINTGNGLGIQRKIHL